MSPVAMVGKSNVRGARLRILDQSPKRHVRGARRAEHFVISVDAGDETGSGHFGNWQSLLLVYQ